MAWLQQRFSALNQMLENLFRNLVGSQRLAGILNDVLFTLIFMACFWLLVRLIKRLFTRLQNLIESWRTTRMPALRIQTLELVSADRLTNLLLWLTAKVRLLLNLFLFYLFIPLLLSYFPQTRRLIWDYLDYILAPLRTIGSGLLAFIPNLIFIGVTLYVLRYVLKLFRLLFSEIKSGHLSLRGFHPEWADPTFKLSRFLLIIFTIVLISPYMPGFGSPAFQGISIFLGLLLSLGSTAAIANVVAGAVLIYMRPFNIGDRVKIADTLGDVIEKTLLVTRIRTLKNVEVTIPNSMVLGSHMINFSNQAREGKLILHADFTLGYDVPWRQVNDLLLAAAQATPESFRNHPLLSCSSASMIIP